MLLIAIRYDDICIREAMRMIQLHMLSTIYLPCSYHRLKQRTPYGTEIYEAHHYHLIYRGQHVWYLDDSAAS